MSTEIFATFGPSCQQKQVLKEMIEAGMTGMRLNLSHTMLADSRDYIEAYQSAAKEIGKEIQILIDMQGPELRIGEIEEVYLQEGTRVCLGHSPILNLEAEHAIADASHQEDAILLDDRNPGTYRVLQYIPVPKSVLLAIEAGDQILLDDGKLLVQAEELQDGQAIVRVLRGGRLRGRKSIKIVNKNVKMPPLTAHDIQNIQMAKAHGVTALMQPFVLCGEDLKYVRNVLKEHGAEDIQIYAKIEHREGVEHIESILQEADVIVIARGDLGNDMPLWELPRVQKQIEVACKKAGKPYIVVTQMLASMENSPVPTRAEVSDIFHAVYHGAWGVMVTGETAIGKYPVEAVRYLANTAEEAEKFSIIEER